MDADAKFFLAYMILHEQYVVNIAAGQARAQEPF